MKQSFSLMAIAMAAALLFAGCQRELNGLDNSDSSDVEYASKAGINIASNKTGNHGESRFNYDNWRDQITIDVYDKNKKECDEINLPWAKVTSTSMPSEYKHPEREFLPDGTPRWELAFNFCDWVSIPGTDMFGLWDAHAQIMRIYTYIEQLPNQNAKSCFYEIRSTAPNYIDPNTRCWMPSEESIAGKTWPSVISGNLPVPSQYTGEILPIAGTLDGEVNPGWVCYEINFNAGLAKVSRDDNITFTLLGVEDIKFTATMDLQGKMTSEGGKITIPGNKTKAAGGILSAIGGMFSGIASAVASGAKMEGPAGAVDAGVGIFGAITSCVGGCLTASQDLKDKTYQLDINFNVSLEGEINGSLTTNLGTTVNAVQIDYDVLFENILAKRNVGSSSAKTLTMGLWNLKNAPVIYVAEDAVFQTGGEGGSFTYCPSFLDPRSIELALNTDNVLFPLSEVDSINLLAYDFVFVNNKYSMPAKPYYSFYGIPQDQFAVWDQEAWKYSCDISAFKQSPDTKFETKAVSREGQSISYTGVADFHSGFGMETYDMIYSPIIHQRDCYGYQAENKYSLDHLGVAAAIEVKYKNGDKRIFADRFLPKVKSFKKRDAQTLKDAISGLSDTRMIGNVPVKNLTLDAQKKRAQTVLDTLINGYPARRLSDDKNSSHNEAYALCVLRPVADTLGSALVTFNKNEHHYIIKKPSISDLETLHKRLNRLNDWSRIDKRLKSMGLLSLDNWFRTYYESSTNYIYQIKKGEYKTTINSSDYSTIYLYSYDEDGIKE